MSGEEEKQDFRTVTIELVKEMIRDIGLGDPFRFMRNMLDLYEVKFFKIYSEALGNNIEHYLGIWYDEDNYQLFDVHFKGDQDSVLVIPEQMLGFIKKFGLIPILCIHNHPESPFKKVLSPSDFIVFYEVPFVTAILLYPEGNGLGMRMYYLENLVKMSSSQFKKYIEAFRQNIKSPQYTLKFQEETLEELGIVWKEEIYK